MSQKEWAILAILAAVAVVFCAEGLLLFAASTPSRTQVVVVEVTATPVPTSALRPTYIPQPIRLPTPTSITQPAIKSGADIYLKEHKCIAKDDFVYCLVVFNNPTDFLVDYVGIHFDFFDSEGVSLGSDSLTTYNLFPRETRKTTNCHKGFYLPVKRKLGKYTFYVFLSDRLGTASGIPKNPFTVSDVEIQGGHVVAIIANSSNKTFKSVDVDVILYDKNGEFTGGGSTVSPLLPAGGKARIQLSVNTFGEVSRIEVYPSIVGATSIE
jgi:hypothetical protein